MTFPVLTPEDLALLAQAHALLGNPTLTASAGGGPPGPGSRLQSLLDAVPVAEDGHVVRAEHWNALRAALVEVARSTDAGLRERVTVHSFSPTLLPSARDAEAWVSVEGRAVGPATGQRATGWMPLALPHGTRIDSLTVRGRRPAAVTTWNVALRRLELAGSGRLDVCAKEVQGEPVTDDAFVATVPPATTGLTAGQLSDRRMVDTGRYRYVFSSSFTGAAQADALSIDLVQVTTTRI